MRNPIPRHSPMIKPALGGGPTVGLPVETEIPYLYKPK